MAVFTHDLVLLKSLKANNEKMVELITEISVVQLGQTPLWRKVVWVQFSINIGKFVIVIRSRFFVVSVCLFV